jgi:hypothetical protein
MARILPQGRGVNIFNRAAILVLLHLALLCGAPAAVFQLQPSENSFVTYIASATLGINFLPATASEFICGHCNVFTESFLGLPTDKGLAISLVAWLSAYFFIGAIWSFRSSEKVSV